MSNNEDEKNNANPSTEEDLPQKWYGDYEVLKAIGKGKFAVVYRARRGADGLIVALKRISVDMIDEKARDKCLKEVRLLQSLDHPNIIKYFDSFISDNDLVIVFEWAAAGDLKRQLRKALEKGVGFEERVIWKYFSQISDAICHMHERRIMHRDLKPANLFLTLDGTIKVGDLGLSRELSENTFQAHSKVGTPLYMSPEVLRGDGYDFKSDIWSLGCLLYELAMLKSPFKSEGLNLYSLFQKISQGQYQELPDKYSSELRNLAYSMLVTNPEDRPEISSICESARKMRMSTTEEYIRLKKQSSLNGTGNLNGTGSINMNNTNNSLSIIANQKVSENVVGQGPDREGDWKVELEAGGEEGGGKRQGSSGGGESKKGFGIQILDVEGKDNATENSSATNTPRKGKYNKISEKYDNKAFDNHMDNEDARRHGHNTGTAIGTTMPLQEKWQMQSATDSRSKVQNNSKKESADNPLPAVQSPTSPPLRPSQVQQPQTQQPALMNINNKTSKNVPQQYGNHEFVDNSSNHNHNDYGGSNGYNHNSADSNGVGKKKISDSTKSLPRTVEKGRNVLRGTDGDSKQSSVHVKKQAADSSKLTKEDNVKSQQQSRKQSYSSMQHNNNEDLGTEEDNVDLSPVKDLNSNIGLARKNSSTDINSAKFMNSGYAFVLMESLFGKLTILGYGRSAKANNGSPKDKLLPIHFACELSQLKGSQYTKFVEVCIWLLYRLYFYHKSSGQFTDSGDFDFTTSDIEIDVSRDPPQSIAKQLLRYAQVYGVNNSDIANISPTSLTPGYGESCCHFMNCISDRIMAYKKIKWSAGALKYPPHVLEEVNNTKNELDGDIDAVDEDISDANQQEMSLDADDDFRSSMSAKEFQGSMILPSVSPEEWRKELERVSTKLKNVNVSKINGIGQSWSGNIGVMSEYSSRYCLGSEGRESLAPKGTEKSVQAVSAVEFNDLLHVMHMQLSEHITGINKIENFINGKEKLKALSEEFSRLKENVIIYETRSEEITKKISRTSEELAVIDETLEELQLKLNSKLGNDGSGGGGAGSGAISDLKGAIKTIKEETNMLKIQLGFTGEQVFTFKKNIIKEKRQNRKGKSKRKGKYSTKTDNTFDSDEGGNDD